MRTRNKISQATEERVCQDYVAREGRRWKYTTVEIAERNGTSAWSVNLIRLKYNVWRNETNAAPRTSQLVRAVRESGVEIAERVYVHKNAMFACPHCGTRSRDRLGHELCVNREAA